MARHTTPAAQGVSEHAFGHARRLGHRYFGAEHFLLAIAGAGTPAGAVLRERGLTPYRVEQELVRLAGRGPGAALFGDLDRDALAAFGVDVAAVRTRLEASAGAHGLARADRAVHGEPGRWSGPGAGAERDGYFIQHSASGVAVLQNSAREAAAQGSPVIDVEHLALGVLAVSDGFVPAILAALSASPAELRARISGPPSQSGG